MEFRSLSILLHIHSFPSLLIRQKSLLKQPWRRIMRILYLPILCLFLYASAGCLSPPLARNFVFNFRQSQVSKFTSYFPYRARVVRLPVLTRYIEDAVSSGKDLGQVYRCAPCEARNIWAGYGLLSNIDAVGCVNHDRDCLHRVLLCDNKRELGSQSESYTTICKTSRFAVDA